jgi:hypothetical protein
VNLVPNELGDEDCMRCANNLWQIEYSNVLDLPYTTRSDLPHEEDQKSQMRDNACLDRQVAMPGSLSLFFLGCCHVNVCMCVCVYVCMYACVYVCMIYRERLLANTHGLRGVLHAAPMVDSLKNFHKRHMGACRWTGLIDSAPHSQAVHQFAPRVRTRFLDLVYGIWFRI